MTTRPSPVSAIAPIDLDEEMQSDDRNISHQLIADTFETAFQKIQDKIFQRKDLLYAPVHTQLELLNALSKSKLGKFLIERGGLNGYWTHYVITYPEKKANFDRELSSIELFLLEKAPTLLATQQRFKIFKAELQKRLKEGVSCASIPCGLMSDLIDLDFSAIHNFTLTGIDLDPESLSLANELALHKDIVTHCNFIQSDAWNLNIENQFDVITSNGLTIYESDDQKVIDLYRSFLKALKPGGELVTSYLTLPPIPGLNTEWDLSKVNPEDALLQKIIFADILDAKWQVYRNTEQVIDQLKKAGFEEIEIIFDVASIFPTAIAKKPHLNL